MNSFKLLAVFFFLTVFGRIAAAQDAVTIDSTNFVRGTIKSTDFASVFLLNDDKTVTQYQAKDVQSFLWNGDTYVSKPIVFKKNMEFRFFKVIEMGAVNLYSLGGSTGAEEAPREKTRIRPSVGIGMGTGGFGGVGFGGGITFGGGRRQNEDGSVKASRGVYYIEKLGTGPIQVVAYDGKDADASRTRALLLQKLTNDDDLAERIKATENFDVKTVKAFVAAYNAMHK
ncbi:hypothetical protein LPB86_03140 [Pedobacter sp. MC2016-14]|uniref:hypothetical protein n=1 Tax=Pedobacter sp. MC2016-14 TaxID=2897327 RepID=UPI001E332C1F|nr:hypothetical protein [Pedobacter sp. MC2016-14]MCD0487206.1 hypothetical protein [Pedobacter sp. MC2016-14]